MIENSLRRTLIAVAAASIALASGIAIPPPAAQAALQHVQERCSVETATLDWGFKESFRAYIDGSIARGEWTVTDGAGYETPVFQWSNGSGSYDDASFAGEVSFEGAVRFTGHEGLLDTTIANPTLQFVDAQTAQLLLDITGVTMEDALAGSTDEPVTNTAVAFAELDLSSDSTQLASDGRTLIGSDVPTTITDAGFEVFPNYEAGTAFDPVNFTIELGGDCSAIESPTATPEAETTPAAEVEPNTTAWLWVAAAAGVLVLAAAPVLLLARRGAGNRNSSGPSGTGGPQP